MKLDRQLLLLILMLCAAAAFAQDKNLIQTPDADKKARPLYTSSHALIIGINRYPGLPSNMSLSYGVKDAADLKDELVKDYGFPASNVTLLTDDQASLQGIRNALAALTDNTKIKSDDRVLIFFSGHGQTVPTPSGGEMGYLIPSDAKVDLNDPTNAGPYNATCLRMKEIWDDLEGCPAKHVLVIADACFSGLLVKSRGGLSKDSIAAMLAKPARQIISGGDKGQRTSERSDLGHGVFTSKLLNHLKSHAADKGRVFAASQLFAELLESVSNATSGKQTPKFGAFDTDGEFLFAPGGVMDPTLSGQHFEEPPAGPAGEPAVAGGIPMRMRLRAGQVDRYRLSSSVTVQGVEVRLASLVVEKILSVEQNGNYTQESRTTNTVVTANGQDTKVPDEPASVCVFDGQGKLIEVKGKSRDSDDFRMQQFQAIFFPTRPIKAGETWDLSTRKPDGSIELIGTCMAEARETFMGVDCLRLRSTMKEMRDTAPMSCEMTAWVSIKDGTLVKAEGLVKNMPIESIGPSDAKITLVLEK